MSIFKYTSVAHNLFNRLEDIAASMQEESIRCAETIYYKIGTEPYNVGLLIEGSSKGKHKVSITYAITGEPESVSQTRTYYVSANSANVPLSISTTITKARNEFFPKEKEEK